MIRGTPYRWLNLVEVCRKLLPRDEVERVKYFTARVDARVGDPDQPLRQMRYWRALRTQVPVEIIQGHFLTTPKSMPELASVEWISALAAQGVDVRGMRPNMIRVLRSEEKGTDVNLAAHLVHDAHRGRFEGAAVISNDSDLKEAIQIVRREVGKVVFVFTPHRKRHSVQLKRTATFFRGIPVEVLKTSLFPDELTDAGGAFRKPIG